MNPSLYRAGIFAVCGLFAFTGSACTKRPSAPPARPPMTVQTTAAAAMDTPLILQSFGHTENRQSVDIVPQVSGMLIQTFIQDGAIVTNGQPLFQIDPRDYATRVQQAASAVAADRANLELSRMTIERYQALRDKQLIASEDFDTLKTRQEAAAAQLQADEALLEQARLNLARCAISAPLAGICSKRALDDGNLVAAGVTRLINIRRYDPMVVEFAVSEEYLPLVRRALAEGTVRIEVTPRGDTSSYPGTLAFLDNAVNSLTGTILLRGLVPNPDLKLWSRQFVQVRVEAGLVPGAVMVPEGAVQFGKQGAYLFVVKDNHAEMRPVTPGIRHANRIQIKAGVAPEELVVVLGQLMLFPGAPVRDTAQPAPGNPGPPADQGRDAHK